VGVRRPLSRGVLTLFLFATLFAQTDSPSRYLSYGEASPVFAALDAQMPSASDWPRRIASDDGATRARVAKGDESAIVNLLLFGTSFTSQPRITSKQITETGIQAAVNARLADFERALAGPGTSERLQFARRVLEDGPNVRVRLLSMIDAAVKETAAHARLMAQAHAIGDPSLEFAERSRLYRDRGLASDTSVRVNFAIEDALRQIHAADPTAASRIRRVAIVGPGLDVADKQEGYDFYPPQTIQPFAVLDSLIRLGLADADAVHVTTFDVSARVNGHIGALAGRARAGTPYAVHVALDGTVEWTPELLGYFDRFGAAVGAPLPVTIPPGLGPLRLRAVAVRPAVAARISARDVNITAQVLPLAGEDRFDLIVGTNVFVYYDRLQQGLAMVSAAAMLRPGGLLLSNNALVELPSTGLRSIGYSRTLYSNRDEDGDVIIWYRKETK
jgi:hypothetical protein